MKLSLLGMMFFAMLLLGFPLFMLLMNGALIMFYSGPPNLDIRVFIQQLITGVDSYILLAIPMFIYAADIITAGESSHRLVDFVKSLFGHVHGGLAISTTAACTAFGSITGSTQATVAAIGKPMRKKLLESGYSDSRIMANIINSSDVAILIPPSTVMIMYAVVTGTSVGDLFISGVLPGILTFFFFSIYHYISARKHQIPTTLKTTRKEKFHAAKRSLLPFVFPVIVLGGIYGGIFSPTEAAAVSILYATVLEVGIYRSIKITDLLPIAVSTGIVTSVVFILVAAGQAYAWFLSYERIPQTVTQALLSIDPFPIVLLIIINLIFFVGCMFVDSLVVITVVTPVIYPVAMEVGIDPVFLGVLVTLQAAIGSATPPFGCDIFTASSVFNKPYLEVIRSTPPYIAMLLGITLLLILFPPIGSIYKYL